MSIEQRRHDALRIKAKRKDNNHVQPNAKSIGKALHTSTLCSCWMCGNPRKHFDLRTIQERRAMQEVVTL